MASHRRSRRLASRGEPFIPEPRSLVHVLVDEQELCEALERAARFEETAAGSLRARAKSYEALLRQARQTRADGSPEDEVAEDITRAS